MPKTYRKKSKKTSIFKDMTKTSNKAIPVIHKGLNTIGRTTTSVAKKSAPIIEKGVATVYGTLATGFDLGVKGATNVASGVKKFTQNKRFSKYYKGVNKKTRRSHYKH